MYDGKSHIFIYSVRPPLAPGQEPRHYFKIGRQLNIKHDNMDRLKRCPMIQSLQSRKHRASMSQLKRTSPTSVNLFMALLRSELVRNRFTLLSQDQVLPPPAHLIF